MFCWNWSTLVIILVVDLSLVVLVDSLVMAVVVVSPIVPPKSLYYSLLGQNGSARLAMVYV